MTVLELEVIKETPQKRITLVRELDKRTIYIKKELKAYPSLEVITIFFRTTFKPFFQYVDFIGFFYTFNFFILFFML